VVDAAADGGVTVAALARLVSADPSFAIQLLRLVNSSVYRRGQKIASVERAVAVLGNRSLRNLALCVAVRSCVDGKELGDFDLNRFWEDSLRRAVASQLLAERVPGYDPTEAFTAGLLQDFGVLALVWGKADRSALWMEFVNSSPTERRAAETELFGLCHDDVARDLAELWSLPPEIAAIMEFHHRPQDAPSQFASRCALARHAEVLAAVLAGDEKRQLLETARTQLGAEAGMASAEVDALLDRLGGKVEEVASELGIHVGAQPSLQSILQVVNSGLVELNLSYEELVRTLEQTIAEKDELARKLEQRNRELEQLSLTDALTGLANRRALAGRLNYELRRVARGGTLVFAIADIDRFKTVNDTWGHEFGDAVLCAVAGRLRETLRDTDMVSRMGGEEFGLVLPDSTLQSAVHVADRILAAIHELVMTCPDGVARSFTVSLGLAAIEGPYRERFSSERLATLLYKAADEVLYQSKENGRDRWTATRAPLSWNEA